MITVQTLMQFCPTLPASQAEQVAPALEQARQQSTVNTPVRLACLMGQLFVESNSFKALEENLNYKDPARLDAIFSSVKGIADAQQLIAKGPEAIANRVYANRLGNGDEASGDGWKFRGSGYIQLTGRANFRRFGTSAMENTPEMARTVTGAAQLAFAFWEGTGCSPLADKSDVEVITEKINGPAKLALAERQAATTRAMGIWK